jgi:hypothetical protein
MHRATKAGVSLQAKRVKVRKGQSINKKVSAQEHARWLQLTDAARHPHWSTLNANVDDSGRMPGTPHMHLQTKSLRDAASFRTSGLEEYLVL